MLSDRDLVATILRLREWRPAPGAVAHTVIHYDDLRAYVCLVLSVPGVDAIHPYPIAEPPNDDTLMRLYCESQRLVAAAPRKNGRPVIEIGGLVIDHPGAGFDS